MVKDVKMLILHLACKNVECHTLWIYGQWKTFLPKYQWWPHFFKVNKPHHSFSSKLSEFFPRSGATHSSTRKAMELPVLNSLHWIKIPDHVILMVKPPYPKASLSVVIALTGVPSSVFRSNQPAANRAKDNDPSEWNRISITWEKTSSNCNVVPSL